MKILRNEGYFRGSSDFEIFYQTWSSDESRVNIIVTHGLGEHSECYHRLAEGLSPGPFKIFAWDLRGHGRSEGSRGVVKSFDDYVKDLAVFIKKIKSDEPQKPLVLVGHSMGGLVTTRFLIDHGSNGITACVLSSPLFGIAIELPKLKETLGRAVGNLLPSLTLHNEIKYSDLTHDESVIDEYGRDVLRHDRISTALFNGMLDSFEMVKRGAGLVQLPIFFQLSGTDKIVSRPKAEELFDKIGSKDKTLKVYENMYHEIYNEKDRAIVFRDLTAWLKKHSL